MSLVYALIDSLQQEKKHKWLLTLMDKELLEHYYLAKSYRDYQNN